MLMKDTSKSIQRFFDDIIYRYLVQYFPAWVTPNTLSYLRIVLVPVLFYLLSINQLVWAVVIFIFAASTDFMDGTLARKKDLVSDLGKALDPIADKMLIATVLTYIGFEYLIVKVFLIVISFEIVAVLGSTLFAAYLGRPIGANIFGKIKMVFQSFAVGSFMLGLISKNNFLVIFSEYLLIAALFFALIAGVEQVRRRFVLNYKNFKN